MQQERIYFHNTFAPVINWSAVRSIIMMAEMSRWESIQIDYVLALSQITNVYINVYLHLPAWFHVDGEYKNETYFIKSNNNIYGTRQSAEIWFDMLKTGLKYEGFKQKK